MLMVSEMVKSELLRSKKQYLKNFTYEHNNEDLYSLFLLELMMVVNVTLMRVG